MQKLKCLIVEDSLIVKQLIEYTVSKIEGMEVDHAENGLLALKKMVRNRYDIIFTDINMPVMDGLKLISKIRKDTVHKDTPIVVITTESSREECQKALELGADVYITKPIKEQVLLKVILEILEKRQK